MAIFHNVTVCFLHHVPGLKLGLPLRKISGAKVAVDMQVDLRSQADSPSLSVYDPGRAFFKSMALKLLGVTALTEPSQLQVVRGAAGAVADVDDKDWTVEDAQKILSAAGTLPAASHVQVWRLPGQATILFRAVAPGTAKARRLTYPSRSARPSLSILAALRPEGIVIPKGMCMDVPIKLVEDDEGLAVAAFFRRGKLRDATEVSGQEK